MNVYQYENITITEYFSLIQHYAIQPLQFTFPVTSNRSFVTYSAIQSIVYKQLHWTQKIINETLSEQDGYLLFPVPFSQMKTPTTLFHCSDGSYIVETLVCDGIEDCNEGTDEKNCICNNCSKVHLYKYNCYNNLKVCTCSDFFYQCSSFQICIPYQFVCDEYNDCQQGEDEICSGITSKIKTGSQHTSNNETFKCLMSGNSIPASFLDDLVPECPTSFEDEVQYYNLLTVPYQSSTPCTNSNELPCVPGHDYCFPLNKLCVYDFHHNSLQLKYCRSGAHLHNCTHFQCLGYFKCPLSHCVPFDLVCDGNWDCSGGHDEHNCLSHSCAHLFRCKNQNKCLHFIKVCDESKDCIYGDDELLCLSGYSLSCPLQCVCFAQSIVCEYLNDIKYQKIWGFIKYFKCYKCTLKINDISFSSLVNIKFLDIKNHFSKHTCIIKDSNNSIYLFLRKLDMSFNKITKMQSSCLESLQSLKILYLQVNRIGCVQDKAFNKLRSLKI